MILSRGHRPVYRTIYTTYTGGWVYNNMISSELMNPPHDPFSNDRYVTTPTVNSTIINAMFYRPD